MNIYEFDLWDGDKGIILAESIEKAFKELQKNYGEDFVAKYEIYQLNFVARSTDKGLFVFE